MTDTILFQEPGVTIAFDSKPGTLAPYFPSMRPDGRNHGYIELRDYPDRVDSIEEAKSSEGFRRVLKCLNRKGSQLLSIGCEQGPLPQPDPKLPPDFIGSYISIVFRDLVAARSKEKNVDLARAIWEVVKTVPPRKDRDCWCSLELIVEPLKIFFNHDGVFSLCLKMLAYGADEAECRETFEWIANAIAVAIDQINSRPTVPQTI